MVLGYHVVFGAYGFWLPNDPRGSWSDFVGSWELYRHGPATKTDTRVSVARQGHDRAARLAAKASLRHPSVQFTGLQARLVGEGFGESARRGGVTVWACSILPEHVHLVIGRHTCQVEYVVNAFKGAATRYLLAANVHPFGDHCGADGKVPCCWARKSWNVYLDDPADIVRAIRYVEDTPPRKESHPNTGRS